MMIIFALLTASMAIASSTSSRWQVRIGSCERVLPRKEFRDMSSSEWNRFLKAYDNVSKRSYRGFPSEIDFWTRAHLDHVPDAHGTPQFFPWHRYYVRAFEQLLQHEDPSVTIPYWDWSADWSEPFKSPVFTRLNIDDCKYRRQLPSPHCLLRNFQSGTAFYSFRAMDRAITNSRSYVDFWRTIEPAPHGIVHSGIGGRNGDMTFMWSPNDPIFWLHHTMIDKLWADWQDAHPRRRNEYGGRTRRGRSVKSSDILSPFNLPVEQAFNYKNFCYYYEPARRAYQSRSNRQRNLKAAIKHVLPPPLSAEFIHHHQMNEMEVRQSEQKLTRWMLEAHREETTIDSPSMDSIRRSNSQSIRQKRRSLVSNAKIERMRKAKKKNEPTNTSTPLQLLPTTTETKNDELVVKPTTGHRKKPRRAATESEEDVESEEKKPKKKPRKTTTTTTKKPKPTTSPQTELKEEAEDGEGKKIEDVSGKEDESGSKDTEEAKSGEEVDGPKIQSDPAPTPTDSGKKAQTGDSVINQPNILTNTITALFLFILVLSA